MPNLKFAEINAFLEFRKLIFWGIKWIDLVKFIGRTNPRSPRYGKRPNLSSHVISALACLYMLRRFEVWRWRTENFFLLSQKHFVIFGRRSSRLSSLFLWFWTQILARKCAVLYIGRFREFKTLLRVLKIFKRLKELHWLGKFLTPQKSTFDSKLSLCQQFSFDAKRLREWGCKINFDVGREKKNLIRATRFCHVGFDSKRRKTTIIITVTTVSVASDCWQADQSPLSWPRDSIVILQQYELVDCRAAEHTDFFFRRW